ncbi:MAG: hypothetical protein ACOH2F_03590 [Cellulomonas sp.]
MAVVGLQPISLRNATLTVAEDDYTQSIDQVTFAPEVDYEWTRGYDDSAYYPYYTGIRWTVALGYAQDLLTPGSLSLYLLEHAAQTRTITFTPVPGSGQRTITADVLIIPGQLGGVPGQILTGSVALPLFGDPLLSMVA